MTIRDFFYKLSFKPPFRQIKEAMAERNLRNRHRRWIRSYHRVDNRRLAASIEIRDDQPITQENVRLGKGVVINGDTTLWIGKEPQSRIDIGDRVFIDKHSCLGAIEPLTIGDDCLIAARCYIITANHAFDRLDIPISQQGYTSKAIKIGRNVWLCTGVVVVAGVEIGDGSIVGAGSVVTKNIPAGEVWAGVPARFIRKREEAK